LTVAGVLWRAFPWDPAAAEGDPFSALHRPRASGSGRFDLPGLTTASSWYFAETPDHAVGERLQDLRNQELSPEDLEEAGHRLALGSYHLETGVAGRVIDLCDAASLVRESISPDALAALDRRVTQGIASRIHASEYAGLRWWSALIGEWHGIVLFTDRVSLAALRAESPQVLTTDHQAVRDACEVLGIRIV
jgi:hypothetical protein